MNDRNEFWQEIRKRTVAQAHDNSMALNAHIDATEHAIVQLAIIKNWLDDHGEVAPDDVNWGHVGTMRHVADQLEEIAQHIRS